MNSQTLLDVLHEYAELFEEHGIEAVEHPHDELLISPERAMEHCHYMLDAVEQFVHEGEMQKACRWLGFIQGVLWRNELYTIDTLKEQNSG